MPSALPLPPPAPSFPFIGITALILIYVVIGYLVIDFVGHAEDNSTTPLGVEDGFSGLSLEEIQELPWFYCRANITTTCAVCLDNFHNWEQCRIFPVCDHVFHAHCIDLWLARRLTCPICRSPFKMEIGLDTV